MSKVRKWDNKLLVEFLSNLINQARALTKLRSSYVNVRSFI